MNDFDLHMHSSYSKDGQFTPKELVGMLKEAKIKTAALCDHDTVEGVLEMIEEGKPIEAGCQFCNKKYSFSVEELEELLQKAVRP